MSSRIFLKLLLLLTLFSPLCLHTEPIVVINEILFKQSNENQEWIEIFNPSDSDVSLVDTYIEDLAKTKTKFSGIVPAQSYRVICRNRDKMLSFYPHLRSEHIIEATSWAVLNNDKETLWLKNKDDTIIDSVSYTATVDHRQDLSIERIDPYDKLSEWGKSISVNLSTPAQPNSLLPVEYDLKIAQAKIEADSNRLRHSVIVKNVGRIPIDMFTLTCSVQLEHSEQMEVVYSQMCRATEDTLFTFSTPIPLEKHTTYRYEIDAEEDLNHSNNTYILSHYNGALPVVINELMYRPNDNEPSWVELKVNDKYENLNTITFTSPRSRIEVKLADFEYLLLTHTEEEAEYLSLRYEIPLEAIFTGLKPIYIKGEELSILDASNNVIESFTYDQKWSTKKGISAERVNPNLPSTDDNWAHSLDPDWCTPGRVNSVYTTSKYEKLIVTVTPNPYSPLRDDYALISYTHPEKMSRINCKIFDLKGRLVSNLINQEKGSSKGSFQWEGLNDNNQPLPNGIYVILFEAVGIESKLTYRQRLTVVLGK
ncbi:MAG: lamin tail domain-containing protein [Candidatus Cloacimonadia bacterium]